MTVIIQFVIVPCNWFLILWCGSWFWAKDFFVAWRIFSANISSMLKQWARESVGHSSPFLDQEKTLLFRSAPFQHYKQQLKTGKNIQTPPNTLKSICRTVKLISLTQLGLLMRALRFALCALRFQQWPGLTH